MAKTKTVEQQRKDFFAREQKAYDQRMKQATLDAAKNSEEETAEEETVTGTDSEEGNPENEDENEQ